MSIYCLLAAFGGGVFAAAIGGLPAFILTGVFSLLGAVAGMVGAPAGAVDILVNYMAFGPFFGPHISFTAGVAAAAYAKKKGLIENGADIARSLYGLGDPTTLAVGGCFGVIGFLVRQFITLPLFGGGISPRLVTDLPGIWVFVGGVLIRLIFGGKLRTGDKVITSGGVLGNCILISVAYSLLVAGIYTGAIAAGVDIAAFGGLYHVLIFGTAAVMLVFAEIGQPTYGCHHIVIIAAEATVQSYAQTNNLMTALIVGVIFGTIAGIICEAEGCLINSGTDSHIDGPGCAIFIMTFVINAIFPAV